MEPTDYASDSDASATVFPNHPGYTGDGTQESPFVAIKTERSFHEENVRHLASGGNLDQLICDNALDAGYIDPHGNWKDAITRLFHAAREGWLSALKWLIASGADVHLGAPYYEWAPLHAAAVEDHHEAVLLLLDAGGRINAPGGRGEGITILHYCATNGLSRMSKLLMSRGASLDALTESGQDPEARARHFASMQAADFQGGSVTANLLAEVRAAGGWRPYVDAPRAELLALRRELPSLRERGRASPSSSVPLHETLFLRADVPDDVFSHVLAFWRTPRDY